MKRNNLFMVAYIIFIFIAAFMRLFFEYSLWTPLVIAITLSSIPFAIEDTYVSLAKQIGDICDINEKFIPLVQKRLQEELEFNEKQYRDIETFKTIKYDISNWQKSINQRKADIAELLQKNVDIEENGMHLRKKQKRFQKRADFFAFCGFLSLFVLLIIASLITIPATMQEVFTVIAFAVILITHQIDADISTKTEKQSSAWQHILKLQAELETDMFYQEKELQELVKDIKEYINEAEEEVSHAD